jgi:hypothetical protein
MIRMVVRALVFLASAAVGLFVAAALVDGVRVGTSGLLTAIVVFAVLQSVLAPFFAKVAARNAPAFLGGIGLLTTFVALFAANQRWGRYVDRRDRRRVAGHRGRDPRAAAAAREGRPGVTPNPGLRAPFSLLVSGCGLASAP